MIKVFWRKKASKGGFGTVYRGFDDEARMQVAVKVLMRDDAESARSFFREYEVMQSLQGFACLPRVLYCTPLYSPGRPGIDGRLGIVMEWLYGETLANKIASGALLAPADAASLATKCLLALRGVHGADVLHRDVHPGNIFLCADGSVRLLDFGCSASLWLAGRNEERLCLSNGYEPPEAHTGGTWRACSDIYMLAKSIQAATRPFVAEASLGPGSQAADGRMARAFRGLGRGRCDGAEALSSWIDACTNPDQRKRPQTCQEALAILG